MSDAIPPVPAFSPPWWLRNAHAQTLAAFRFRPTPELPWRRERLELPDGDFIDCAHLDDGCGPIVCLFHGLEGCISSHYVGGLAQNLRAHGMRVSFMHWRGCSGEANRLPRAYHSGATEDISYFIDTIARSHPDTAIHATGFSLGGNALLQYLALQEGATQLTSACAVSIPFDLGRSADYIDRGFSRRYQAYLLRRMKRSTRARARRQGGLPVDMTAMESARNFREFDQEVTAPLHGFAGAEDYYRRASSLPGLQRIRVPTLIIHARDDPFVDPVALPHADIVSPAVHLEISRHGGHVGFLARGARAHSLPLRWLDLRIPAWFANGY